VSWTAWAYYPKNQGSDCPTQGLLWTAGDPASVKAHKLDAPAVPYATAIAGTPRSTSLDRQRLTYTSTAVPSSKLADGARAQVFVPERFPKGYKVVVRGARVVSAANARHLIVRAVPARAVSIRVQARP
jgi:endoglycosylceramidase